MCNKKVISIDEANDDLNNVKKEYKEIMKDLEGNKNNFKYWTKSCFIVFNTISDCEKYYNFFAHTWYRYIIFNFKQIFYCCCKAKAKGKSLTWMKSFNVERAPEPEDVYWENFIYTDADRNWRRFITLGITILLSTVNFGIVLALNYANVILLKKLIKIRQIIKILTLILVKLLYQL